MTQSIAILGRQPALGLAELESLFGAAVTPLGSQAALLDINPSEIAFSRLGGTVKLAKLIAIQETTEWGAIETWLIKNVAPHTDHVPEGKMDVGLSVYGLSANPKRINATALELKKAIRAHGRSVRVVPNKTAELSSAQVLHNNLTGPRGWELLFIKHGRQTYIAQTVAIQDIDAYAARDQKRPKRDARVGMLPPKLAQIIVNLATGPLPPSVGKAILDPFCGTGVVLQESYLMGYEVYGSDLDPRMIDYTNENLKWVIAKEGRHLNGASEVADATTHIWQEVAFSRIACETYLGRPFSALPTLDVLSKVMQDVDTIHRKFLQNVRRQTKPGFRMCIAVPAWKVGGLNGNGFKHLKVLDSLEELGYTRTVFSHVEAKDLVYYRPEQIVARELVVLTRK